MTLTLPSAVLFDMDGTLIDSEMYWLNAERALVEEFGGVWTAEHGQTLVGSALDRTASLLIEAGVELDPETVIERLSQAVKRQVAETLPWRPGAQELLADINAAGVPMALVTMSYSLNALDFAQRATQLLGFAPFTVIVSGDDVRRGKPDPEPYRMGAERLGVEAARCVAVEDSIPGVMSALGAGMATIGVPLFHDLRQLEALTIWESLEGKTAQHLAEALSESSRRTH